MGHLEERDLRSLERRSMYQIFAPLDEDERISRRLIQEDNKMPTDSAHLWVWGFMRRYRNRKRSKAGGGEWIPAMFMFVRRFG
jgi:hypothetical protein